MYAAIRVVILGLALLTCSIVTAQQISEAQQAAAEQIGKQLAGEAFERKGLLGDIARETRGVIVAEGDSWFDYSEPRLSFSWRIDVLKVLDSRYGYDVRSVAHFGHTLESMAYDSSQLAEVAHELEKLRVRGTMPRLKAILLSAGGNDVAGPELGVLMNHANAVRNERDPSSKVFAEKMILELLDVRITNAWISFLTALTELTKRANPGGGAIPIVIHGYDHPIPDGRGWLGGGGPLPGPWLEPAFVRKGYRDQDKNREQMARLIKYYNVVLSRIVNLGRFPHVYLVHTEGLLRSGNHEDDWINELHPTDEGFRKVAGCIHQSLELIQAGNKAKIYECPRN